MYEVRKKGKTRSDHQSSIDATSTASAGDALKIMRLLVTWKIECSGKPSAHVALIEHDDNLVLNEDTLAHLYDKVNDILLHNPLECTSLMCYDAALAITRKVVRKTGLELKITVSQGIKDKYTMKPIWIDSKRQVSSLMI
jgi:hypothetical protein